MPKNLLLHIIMAVKPIYSRPQGKPTAFYPMWYGIHQFSITNDQPLLHLQVNEPTF